MKSIVCGLFYLFVSVGFMPKALATPLAPEDWSNYSKDQIEELNQKIMLERKQVEVKNLLQAKQFLINGNIKWAKYFLNKINTNESSLNLVAERYRAWIAFIEGDYERTLEILDRPHFRAVENFKEICLLKVLTGMIKEYDKNLENEISYCSTITASHSTNEQYWFNNLISLKKKDFKNIKGMRLEDIQYILSDPQMVRIWMKTGIYLNREGLIQRHLVDIPSSVYRSKRTRELIGFFHYRMVTLIRPKTLSKILRPPMQKISVGTSNLKEKKYELAFGHFKLALAKKANSLNALERAIPLAWVLEQWRDGLELIGRLVNESINPRKKDALESVFHIRMDNYALAERKLRVLDSEYQGQPPLEVGIMRSYVALRRNDPTTLYLTSKNACRRFDGLNCWLLHQQIIWENIGKTIERDDTILGERTFEISALKEGQEITPIMENVYIDQKDIEELDSQLIKVNPELYRQ